jgi:hypothetical protein
VTLEITPEPSEEERQAIAAALAAEAAEGDGEPEWPRLVLPQRGDQPDDVSPV